MKCVRFLPKAVTVYSGEKKGFDCKNNHGCGKITISGEIILANLIV